VSIPYPTTLFAFKLDAPTVVNLSMNPLAALRG
jgi:hypothetical protein